ncbi:response regulator transcription factor [Jeotgalibacillus sp. ET6]|uniref:response regulator transcription factor n=1 Tax=Jeotgalibacillus sp. ET6 TaxID=3037260 RepID=UPI002418A10B|nr:response regulator transcription factor [Jeotgalibacillus sp. ET6]MDG5472388.1 response regulator transcription factor [Jeotgalibacillus sp. ET6]
MAYKVFLVDDDRYVRKGLINLIDWKSCGFEVCAEADNGEDALVYIQENTPDLVITDIKMPVVDGLTLIKSALELNQSIPDFIIITGYSDFKYAQKAVKYGVHDFILKPVDKFEIEETLKKVAKGQARKLKLKQNREHTLAEAAFNDLITGGLDQEQMDASMLNLMGSPTKGIAYIIIEINNIVVNTIKSREIVNKVMYGEEIRSTALFREHGNNRIGLLVNGGDLRRFRGDIHAFSENLQDQLSACLKTEVTIYVGKVVDHAGGIKESYDAAMKALQFKFLEKSDKVIAYDYTGKSSVNYIELEQSFYQLLMEQIEENKTDEIKKTAQIMFEQFESKAFAKDAVRTSINRVIHEVVRTVRSMEGDETKLASLQMMLNWDNLPRTLSEIKKMFVAFLLEAAAMLKRMNRDCGAVNIRRIKKYVDTNYQADLTLKTIANKFFLNPVYLGQLFKKTYGMYFKDYILQVRISEAKKKLRQTDMRIFQVAESVGFSNADYFVTQFEKATGMTPTQYRKKL